MIDFYLRHSNYAEIAWGIGLILWKMIKIQINFLEQIMTSIYLVIIQTRELCLMLRKAYFQFDRIESASQRKSLHKGAFLCIKGGNAS